MKFKSKTLQIFPYRNCWDVKDGVLIAHLRQGIHQASNVATEEIYWSKDMNGYGDTIYIRDKYFLDTGAVNGIMAYELTTGNEVTLTDDASLSYQPYSREPVSQNKWIVDVGNDDTSQTGLFDSTTNQLVWTADSQYRFVENLLCSDNNERFVLYDINSGQPEWQVDVRELGRYIVPPDLGGLEREGRIISVLGMYNGIVWLHLESCKLLGIDVCTGSILHQIGPVVPPPEFNIKWRIPSTHKCSLDKERGEIIGMHWKLYWTIDLKHDQPELNYHWLADELDTLGVYEDVPYGGCSSLTHFFFAQYDEKRIVSLNRQTLAVDWIHQLKQVSGKRSTINRMQYDSGCLFVFETAGLLHIFS